MRLTAIVFSTAACICAASPVSAEGSASLESYREMLERPLFSPARRAAPGADPASSEPADLPVLQGVVLSQSKKIALISYDSKTQRVQEGHEAGAWKVQSIAKDHVVFRGANGTTATARLKPTMTEAAPR
jgi:type II secretory pathway component PulC